MVVAHLAGHPGKVALSFRLQSPGSSAGPERAVPASHRPIDAHMAVRDARSRSSRRPARLPRRGSAHRRSVALLEEVLNAGRSEKAAGAEGVAWHALVHSS